MTGRDEEQSLRVAEFKIDDATFILRGRQIDELWKRLTPYSTWREKLRDVRNVQDEVEP